MLAQKAEELDRFACTPLHHFAAGRHLGEDGSDLRRAEIEFAIKLFNRMEDFGVIEMRIAQSCDLHAVLVDEL